MRHRIAPSACLLFVSALAFCAEPAPAEADMQSWIKQLGHEDYQTRVDARARILRAGKSAIAPLKAVTSEDLEVKKAVAEILAQVVWLAIPEDVHYLNAFPDQSIYAIRLAHLGKSSESARATAIGKLLESEAFRPLRELLVQRAQAASPAGFAMLQAWWPRFQGQIGAAVWNMNFQNPGEIRAAAAIELTGGAPDEIFRAFLKEFPYFAGATTSLEGGLAIHVNPQPENLPPGMEAPNGAVALAGRHLVLGVNKASVLEVAQGLLEPAATNLRDSTLYQKIRPRLGQDPDLTFVMNMQAYLGMIGKLGDAQAGVLMDKMGYDALEYFAMSSRAEGAVFVDRFVTVFNEQEGQLKKLQELAFGSGRPLAETLQQAPADAALVMTGFMDGVPILAFGREYLKALSEAGVPGGPDFVQKAEELETALNFKLDDLAACLKGDVVWWTELDPEDLAMPQAGVSIECPDAAKAQELAGYLEKALSLVPAVVAQVNEAGTGMPPDAVVEHEVVEDEAAAPEPAQGAHKAPEATPPQAGKPPADAPKLEPAKVVHQVVEEGRTVYTEWDESPLVRLPGRSSLPYRLSWAVHENRVIVTSSKQALHRRLNQLARKAPGFDAKKVLPADGDPAKLKNLIGLDVAKTALYAVRLGGPMVLAQSEDDKELQKALEKALQAEDLFKTLPPLAATAEAPLNHVSYSEVRGPLPYLPTAFGLGAGMVWFMVGQAPAAAGGF